MAYVRNAVDGTKDIMCIALDDVSIMKIGHLRVGSMLPVGRRFNKNELLGIVADPYEGNNFFAHIHIEQNELLSNCKKAPTIPFAGRYRFDGAPNMTYDYNGTPDKLNDDPENQWAGTPLTR